MLFLMYTKNTDLLPQYRAKLRDRGCSRTGVIDPKIPILQVINIRFFFAEIF